MPDKFREDSLLVSLEQKIIIAFLSKGKWVKSRERGYGSEEESEKKEDDEKTDTEQQGKTLFNRNHWLTKKLIH